MTTVIANRPTTLGVARRSNVGNSGPCSICCVRDAAGVALLAPARVMGVLMRASAGGGGRDRRSSAWVLQIHGRLGREPPFDLACPFVGQHLFGARFQGVEGAPHD